ncbi:hypothetical protein BJ165DRAFT_290063 [Panaeolus papilionaceus]|nr:hypothetical protein BJ165DRAFT_290063 [Panaeolus papilionaceus]
MGRKSQSSARNSSQPHLQNQNQTHSRPPSRTSTVPNPTPAFVDFGAHIPSSTPGSVNQQHQTQPTFVVTESVNHPHSTFGNHNQHSSVVWALGDSCPSATRAITSTASSASAFVEVDNNTEGNNAEASYHDARSVNLDSTHSSNSLNPNTSYATADANVYSEVCYQLTDLASVTQPPILDIAQGRVASPFTCLATPLSAHPATLTPFNYTTTLTPNASSTAPINNSLPPTISCTPPTPGIDFNIAGFESLRLDSSTLSSAATSASGGFGAAPSSPAPRPASPVPRSTSPAPGPVHTTTTTTTHTTDGHSTTSPFATPPPADSTPAGESVPSFQSCLPISNSLITNSTIIMHTHTHTHISGGIGGPRGPRGSPRASPRASPRMMYRELPEVPGVGSSPRGSPRVLGRELPEVPAQRDVLRDWSWGLKGGVGDAVGYEGLGGQFNHEGLGGMRMRRKEQEERGEEGKGEEKGEEEDEVKKGARASAWAGENEKDASAVDFAKRDDTGGDESDGGRGRDEKNHGNTERGEEGDAESGRMRADNHILAAANAARDKRGGGSRVGTPVGKRELVSQLLVLWVE